ncbi:site-2 protease family protein [Candidatus Marinamargulisbacteria bacterium SCGC AG-410-N11]|nr:site-2 protease family protein [Candidatus Marinamargulisbacteria bacterium SCGC AG-410-N11]
MTITMIVSQITILLISIVIHELAHAFTAYKLGDPTAKNLGRLTLNPIKHLDIIGSFILPASLAIINSPVMLGWAKPVPVDCRYFKNPVKDMAKVAIAGPLSNIILACIGILLFKLKLSTYIAVYQILYSFILINLILAIFNLHPIPPLDGSRIIKLWLSPKWQFTLDRIEPFGILIIFGLLYFNIFDISFNFIIKYCQIVLLNGI